MWLIRSSRWLNQAAFEAPLLSHTKGTEVCGSVGDRSRMYTPVVYTVYYTLHAREEWGLLKLLKYSNISYTPDI